jgi:nitrogen regulatory protein PII
MKAVLVIHNQAQAERVEYMLDRLKIKGYTRWENVQGRGTETGDPRMGTHTWPEMNSAVLVVLEDERVEDLLSAVRKLDAVNEEVGIRAFVWEILITV